MQFEEDLKLCSCGGDVEIKMEFEDHPRYHSSHGYYFVECKQCGARGAMKNTKQEAADIWNSEGKNA